MKNYVYSTAFNNIDFIDFLYQMHQSNVLIFMFLSAYVMFATRVCIVIVTGHSVKEKKISITGVNYKSSTNILLFEVTCVFLSPDVLLHINCHCSRDDDLTFVAFEGVASILFQHPLAVEVW